MFCGEAPQLILLFFLNEKEPKNVYAPGRQGRQPIPHGDICRPGLKRCPVTEQGAIRAGVGYSVSRRPIKIDFL